MTAIGLTCPQCGQRAAFALVGDVAFCGDDACPLLCWDPAMTLEEHRALPIHYVDLTGQSGGATSA